MGNGDFWDDYRKIDEENSKFKLALEEQQGNFIFRIFSFIYNGKEYCFKCTGEYISITEGEIYWLSFKQVFPYTTIITKYSDSEQ